MCVVLLMCNINVNIIINEIILILLLMKIMKYY